MFVSRALLENMNLNFCKKISLEELHVKAHVMKVTLTIPCLRIRFASRATYRVKHVEQEVAPLTRNCV